MANSNLFIDKLWVDDDAFIHIHDNTDYLPGSIEGEDYNTTRLIHMLHPCEDEVDEDVYNYSFVELLIDEDDRMVESKVTPIEKIKDPWVRDETVYRDFVFEEFLKTFYIRSDGFYTYVKMLVPKDRYFYDGNTETYTFKGTSGEGMFFVEGTSLKYMPYGTYNTTAAAVVVDAKDVWDNHEQDDNHIMWFARELFCIAHLKKCLLKLEKRILENTDCRRHCDAHDELHYQRDLMMDAYRVLNWLSAHRKFEEASAILRKISSCTTLCDDTRAIKNCGCGKSVR